MIQPEVMQLAEELQARLDEGNCSDEAAVITVLGLASQQHLDQQSVAPVLKHAFRGDMYRLLATLQKASPHVDEDFLEFVENSIPSK